MRRLAQLSLALFLAASAPPAFAQTAPPAAVKAFQRDDLSASAARLEERMKREYQTQPQLSAQQLKRVAEEALRRNDGKAALTASGTAAARNPRDVQAWRLHSQSAQSIQTQNWSERYDLMERSVSGAYLAYIRAGSRADEASALGLLGGAFEKREMWRPALTAYKLSLDYAENAELRKSYETLLESKGFRLVDYKVDSDAVTPRACFEFSEPLAKGRIDFTPFVAVTGPRGDTAVTAEDKELCVEGLRHGERYAIVIRQGVPSIVGENLRKNADYEFYVRDRSPNVRFTGKNYVLPRTGQQGLPVVSINVTEVKAEVFRIGDRNLLPAIRSDEFLQQLSQGGAARIADQSGTKVWSGALTVRPDANKDVVTSFPVLEAVKDIQPGIYVMTAEIAGAANPSDGDGESTKATQWFVVSDIGLTSLTANDGLHVIARSLADARPVQNIELRLVARNNEILGTARTDAAGRARFDPGLARGASGMAPAMLTAADGRGDYGFLDLEQNAFDLTDRGVKGRAAPGPLDAFVYAERGVYRAGETAYITAILRDASANAVSGLPLTMTVQRPDGVEYRRQTVADQGLGGRALSVPLVSSAPPGTWRVRVFSDPKRDAIGETKFLVEDYIPERVEFDLKPKKARLSRDEPAEIEVSARYLYGAPGSDLEVSGEVTLQAATDHKIPGLEGYEVGVTEEAFQSVTNELEEKPTTDDKGNAVVTVKLPEANAPRPLEARIALRVGEAGGRAVTRSVTLPVMMPGTLIGVKKLFDDSLPQGADATFDVVMATAEGRRAARQGVTWSLSRVERRYQWFFKDNRWAFESVKLNRKVADGRIDVTTAAPARIAAKAGWGSYQLDVFAAGVEGAETSIRFFVGYSSDQTADTPDTLDVTLDKQAYAAGDTMLVTVKPQFASVATIAIISDKLHAIEVINAPAEGATARIPVRAEWGAGAYAVAFAHRPLDQAAKRAPGRALGLAWFQVDREKRQLSLDLGAPQKARPRGKLELPVKIGGLQPGEEAYVTLAAVDIGILNLTRYESPKPNQHFYGQRQLGAEIRDLYGFLIDGMQGTLGAIRSGGDAAAPQGDSPPPVVEPVARYSGVVRVGADGTARISFDMPAFNGAVRVMGVAWSKDKTGEASSDVIIRDEIVVQATLPRFLNVGDQSRLHFEIDNVEGPAGDYTLDLDIRGPVGMPAEGARQTLRLEAGRRRSVTVPLTAGGIGTGAFDLKLSGANLSVTHAYKLRIQPPAQSVASRTVRPLAAGGSITLSPDLFADLLPDSGQVSVSVSPFAALDVPAVLAALDRYPYGCTEQTISRAMPLLYVNSLASQEHLALDGALDERVRGAIDRVLARQGNNGSFGLWSAGGDDLWLDAFAGDFLTRARERGHSVPARAFDMLIDRLRNQVVNITDVDKNEAPGIAYALYVLARNGRPVIGDLRYVADTKIDSFATALGRAQIAAALSLLGDRGRAQTAFRNAFTALRGDRDTGFSRQDYGSVLRDSVGLLALLGETNAPRAEIEQASVIVEEARNRTRYTSTQEMNWMILAAQALSKETGNLTLEVDGRPHQGPLYRTLKASAIEAKPMVISNPGQGAARAIVTVAGVPASPEPAVNRGFGIERQLYTMKGEKVDPARIKQNDRVVVVLTVTEPAARYGRVLLVDPLPAGLEIDNPKLVEGTSLEGMAWLKQSVEAEHTEYRDDRFVAAFNRGSGQNASFQIAYIVRAVSPGRYAHPGAFIEDMYWPERFGRGAFGTVDIDPAR